MNTASIEELDRSRFKLSQWFAVGWGTWFGLIIIKEWLTSPALIGLLVVAGLVAWGLWITILIRIYRWRKIVHADNLLKMALNDELHQSYRAKSLVAGYVATTGSLCLSIAISSFIPLPALMMLEIILYVSVLSVLIASLYYQRS